jgi:hypothetical protein
MGFSDQEASQCDQSIFRQWSWDLCEYQTAMKNENFRSSVTAYMDAPMDGFDGEIEAKFFYAGGSARYMFEFRTKEVQTQILNEVKKHGKTTRDAFALGQIHSLFGLYEGCRYEIISEFAKSILIAQCGQEELIRLGDHQFNDSIRGSIFELFFKKRAIDFHEIDLLQSDKAGNKKTLVWKIQGVSDADFRNMSTCPLDTLMWPLNSQEPTIDGLIVSEFFDENNTFVREIKFLQITVAGTHKADLAVLERHMKNLNGTRASVYFVVPSKPARRVFQFRVSPIKNPKALASYGWPTRSDEIQSHVNVLALPSWDD